MEFPNKLYNIILADPPWAYEDKALAGDRGAGCKYDLMTEKELKQLPVKKIAANDCALFMWATFPKLQEALDLVKAWGFEYKTVAFTWVKKTNINTNFIGMGNWTRANAEIVLLGIKGHPQRIDASVPQIIQSVVKGHSEKPQAIRYRIVQLLGDLPRIELFARIRVEGWDVFGNDEMLDAKPLEYFTTIQT